MPTGCLARADESSLTKRFYFRYMPQYDNDTSSQCATETCFLSFIYQYKPIWCRSIFGLVQYQRFCTLGERGMPFSQQRRDANSPPGQLPIGVQSWPST